MIAELLLDLHTRNLATQALYERISTRKSDGYVAHSYPGLECIKIIYEGTVRGDLMRELIVDSWYGLRGHDLLQCVDLPKRFLRELATAALGREIVELDQTDRCCIIWTHTSQPIHKRLGLRSTSLGLSGSWRDGCRHRC